MRTRLLTLTVLAAVLLLPAPTTAKKADPLDSASGELAETEAILENASEEAKLAGRALIQAQQLLPKLRNDVNVARGAVAAARVKASSADDEVEEARHTYEEAREQHEAAGQDVSAARAALSDVASRFYQREEAVALGALLTAEEISIAADTMSFAKQMVRDKQEVLSAALASARHALETENALDTARETAEAGEAAAGEALRQAESQFQVAEQAREEWEGLLDEHDSAGERTESHKDATLARYDDAERASEQVAGQLRGASVMGENGAEDFLMPVNGWKSSDYGMRFDPVYQVEQLHAGVDFAAGRGEAIRAAAGGEVIEAGWNGGYGNYTCVHHGDDISTCYGHQSRISVSQGEQVARGDTIGEVGTTGASTGDHLHFEVRRDGDPVEPLEWLPKCLC